MAKKSTQPTSEIPIRVVDVDLLRIQDPSWNELLWVDHRTELGRLGPGGELLGLDRFKELQGTMGRQYFKLADVQARLITVTGQSLAGLNWSTVMALLRSGAAVQNGHVTEDEMEILYILDEHETLMTVEKIIGALKNLGHERSPTTVKGRINHLIDIGFAERSTRRGGVQLTPAGKAKVRP